MYLPYASYVLCTNFYCIPYPHKMWVGLKMWYTSSHPPISDRPMLSQDGTQCLTSNFEFTSPPSIYTSCYNMCLLIFKIFLRLSHDFHSSSQLNCIKRLSDKLRQRSDTDPFLLFSRSALATAKQWTKTAPGGS